MRTLLLLLTCSAAACATSSRAPVHVVDVRGNPVTTTARLDAEVSPIPVIHCGLDRYVVVASAKPFLMGSYVGSPTAEIADPVALCQRIRDR